MSWAERKSLKKLSEKIPNQYQNKKFHSFNTYIFKNSRGFYVKVYKPFEDSNLPPVCKILSPSDVSFQFHEYNEGESSFEDIKKVMQRQEMAIESDRKIESLMRKIHRAPLMNENTLADILDEEESELSIQLTCDEYFLWYVLIMGCGPWEAWFLAITQYWYDYGRESFDEYYSILALESSEARQVSESMYEFMQRFASLQILSLTYIKNFFRSPSDFLRSASDFSRCMDELKIDSQYDLLE